MTDQLPVRLPDSDLKLIAEGKYPKEVPLAALMSELIDARQLAVESEDLIRTYRIALNGPQVSD